MTIEEARIRNAEGLATGGCWRCIRNAVGSRDSAEPTPALAKTQWEMSELKFIGHRAFCREHWRQEIEASDL